MAGLSIRSAARSDTSAIVGLLNETFRTPIDAATWEWYVYGNPLGSSRAYVALEQQNQEAIAGVIAFAPIRLRIQGVPVMADYAHHLALKMAYRETLSYIAILRHSLNAQASLGIKLAIGPPNRTAYPIHKMLMKWTDFGFLDCLRKMSPGPQNHTCQEIGMFDSQFDRFYEQVSKNLVFCVEKDSAWMNWRFCRRPGAPYTVYAALGGGGWAGYVILKRWQEPDGYRKAHIVDLHAADEAVLTDLIRAAESYAAGCNELNLWSIAGYPYRNALEAMGFAPSYHQPLLIRTYDTSRLEYPGGPASLSYGDGDTLY